jgi:hypothetical protein
MPGALAAALVDIEGETVDYAGETAPYAVRLAAAYWRIALHQVRAQAALSEARTLAIRAARRSFVVYALPHDYAIVVILSAGAGLAAWRRGLSICATKLAGEAGWGSGPQPPAVAWYAAEISCDDRRRPTTVWIAGRPHPIEILGAIVGAEDSIQAAGVPGRRVPGILFENERGWRVRVGVGEATLVREPGGLWYVDQPLAGQGSEQDTGQGSGAAPSRDR